ncbi:MAG: nucleotide pyrophosphatase/phosphodiesterase family protein [Myxococcota bacterium]
MKPLVVLDVVGLTPRLLARTTHLRRLAQEGFAAELGTVLPAVTCSVQATLLTGRLPREHGIVGNGWYFRDLSEVLLWRQSNRLIDAPKVWDVARRARPDLRVAKLFWWFNMYSTADFTITPRPTYPADGRKIFGVYTQPPSLRHEIEEALGPFPFARFWGPAAGLASSRWIADAARHLLAKHRPDLTLVYLPHLDYDLQRFGPDGPEAARALSEIDQVAGALADAALGGGAAIVVLSEYGIAKVTRPVHLNRVLREAGLLAVTNTAVGELLDAGASRAFAVADHQVAQVYLREAADAGAVAALLRETPGVGEVLDADGKRRVGLDHPRAGDLVAVAEPGAWFTYYYWLDDARAPDFARTVDIHRKPGYDPVELFLDPDRPLVRARVALRLAQKALGFRYLMDVIPLRADLVRGSHGRLPDDPRDGPVLVCTERAEERSRFEATDVFDLLLRLLAA